MKKISIILFFIVSIASVGCGSLYLFRGHLMNYHIAFLGMSEIELNTINPRICQLYNALMQVTGGCILAIGITSFFLIKELLKNFSIKLLLCLQLLYLISLIPMAYVTYNIACNIQYGQPKPPFVLTILLIIISIVGSFIYIVSNRKHNEITR